MNKIMNLDRYALPLKRPARRPYSGRNVDRTRESRLYRTNCVGNGAVNGNGTGGSCSCCEICCDSGIHLFR